MTKSSLDQSINSLIRKAASSAESFDQADKNEIGEYLLSMSKAIESLWSLMDEDLLFHPIAAQLLGGIEDTAGSIRMMLVAAIIERDPGALHMAMEIGRREREAK